MIFCGYAGGKHDGGAQQRAAVLQLRCHHLAEGRKQTGDLFVDALLNLCKLCLELLAGGWVHGG
jgi:hypothetical protein